MPIDGAVSRAGTLSRARALSRAGSLSRAGAISRLGPLSKAGVVSGAGVTGCNSGAAQEAPPSILSSAASATIGKRPVKSCAVQCLLRSSVRPLCPAGRSSKCGEFYI